MAYSTNLYRVRQIYYFRCRIPADLKGLFPGKEDFKRSLRTKSLTHAQGLHRLWSAKTERTFMMIRSGMLTPEQVREIAESWKRETLRECEDRRAAGHGVPRNESELTDILAMVDDGGEAREALAYNDFSKISGSVDAVIREQGLEVSKGSAEYATLSRALLQKLVEVQQIELQRTVGNYQNGFDDAAPVVTVAATEAPMSPCAVLMLSVAVERYIEEAKTMESAGEATIYEAVTKCNQFVKVVQDKPIGELSRADVMRFLDVLKRLPPNATKSPRYRDKTLEELLAMKSTKTLSGTTVNNYMSRIKGFLEWCVRMGYLSRNPADGVTYGKKSLLRPDEQRKAFAKADLQKMTDSYLDLAERKPAQLRGWPERLWLPLVSLFSGMRVNEIAQLHAGDVLQDQESGIWYFNVELSEEGEGEGAKRVKSAAARRMIPVHPTLESLGFIDYVKKVHADGSPRYWMNLSQTGRGYHKSFANWFLGNGSGNKSGFLRKHVTTDTKINFHSLRHTFADALKQSGVVHHTAAELMGHAQEDMTFGRYGKSGSLQLKLEALKGIDYGVDFGGLREVAGGCAAYRGVD